MKAKKGTQAERIRIRLAKVGDLKEYTLMLQKTYQKAYTKPSIGLTKDCFSKKVFFSKDTQRYLKSNLAQGPNQRTWLAFLKGKLAGAITIASEGKESKLRGFYVSPEFQNLGIGKTLFGLALSFSEGRDIALNLYAHNRRTINIYKKWGFAIDRKRGVFYRHWPEWPEGLKAKCIYMRFRAEK